MNNILTMTLLAAGLAGNVFVYGQVPLKVISGKGREAPGTIQMQFRWNADTVVMLAPDRMPCLVSRRPVEPMPVKKLWPVEPMPVKKLPRVEIIPVKQ
jgi:hypothetical protein